MATVLIVEIAICEVRSLRPVLHSHLRQDGGDVWIDGDLCVSRADFRKLDYDNAINVGQPEAI
jgi:hypothetical protein